VVPCLPACGGSTDLHSQRTTVDSQDHTGGALLYRSTCTPAVGVRLAHGFAVAGGGLPHRCATRHTPMALIVTPRSHCARRAASS